MEQMQLKENMKRLWKDTFSDPDSYINMIFDQYFNPETIAYREEKGSLVAALLGVPYRFESSPHGSAALKGLYLCGLSTVPSHRNRGLMSQLIEEINRKAFETGYDFTFLIPASEGLTRYYKDRGYVPTFYYYEENYVSDHDFEGEFTKTCKKNNEYLKIENFENLNAYKANFRFSSNEIVVSKNPNLPELLISFLSDYAPRLKETREEKSFSISHSKEDWETVVRENVISDDLIFVCLENSKIKGAAFTACPDGNHIKVKKIITSDPIVKIKLLDAIKKHFPEMGMTVISYSNEKINDGIFENQIWNPFYIHNNLPEEEYEDVSIVETSVLPQNCTKSFGMCRILNASEILKKITNESINLKFSILRNAENLLLRRPHHPDYVGEAFDCPLLSLSAFLLLE